MRIQPAVTKLDGRYLSMWRERVEKKKYSINKGSVLVINFLAILVIKIGQLEKLDFNLNSLQLFHRHN